MSISEEEKQASNMLEFHKIILMSQTVLKIFVFASGYLAD